MSRYIGSDPTSYFSISFAMTDKYAAVGSIGYNQFTGRVDIYKMLNQVTWQLLTTISAPPVTALLSSYQFGFGMATAIEGNTMIAASQLYGKNSPH